VVASYFTVSVALVLVCNPTFDRLNFVPFISLLKDKLDFHLSIVSKNENEKCLTKVH
jgi:hypothetical protein